MILVVRTPKYVTAMIISRVMGLKILLYYIFQMLYVFAGERAIILVGVLCSILITGSACTVCTRYQIPHLEGCVKAPHMMPIYMTYR